MKIILIVQLLCCCFCIPINASGGPDVTERISLSGKVTDKANGNPIPGATIYIPDLKTGSITNQNGEYVINDLPPVKLRIQVTYIGYKMIIRVADLSVTNVLNFEMEESVSELSEIVVTGLSLSSEKNRAPTPITTIPSLQLQQSDAMNIVDALTTIPGVSQVTTGAAISKPVIRGLGFNRVVVVHDGIRQEGQQWGDEHGIEIDEFAVDHVEVLKGPASLVYGSDAMAGVINLLSAPTLPEGNIQGKAETGYHTNNGLISYSVQAGGNKKNNIWDIRWSQKYAHSYKNKEDGYVANSGFSERALSGILGVNKSWGYSHLIFSYYRMKPGIVEGERDSLTGAFIKPIKVNDTVSVEQIVTEDDFKSYVVFHPFQEIQHYKMVLNNNLVLGDASLRVIAGWQQNQRKEFGDILDPGTYGLYFLLNTFNFDVRYTFAEKKGFNLSVGLNGMLQDSRNEGSEFLVPEYRLFDSGIYMIARRTINKWDISGGIRYDFRNVTAFDLFLDELGRPASATAADIQQKFKGFDSEFTGISGSLGASYQFSDILYSKLNLSRGFRAPNIAELGSNGEHEGSGRYEIGNATLKSESSTQLDFTFGINSEHVIGEINLFTNYIDNFIFISRVSSVSGIDSVFEDMPVYEFTSGQARLSGGEISLDIHPHPLDWLHFENSFAYVEGLRLNQPGNEKYLPLMPPAKWTSEIKATLKKLTPNLQNSFLKLNYVYTFDQDKIYAVNNSETPTASYNIFNFSAGTDFVFRKKTILSFYFNIHNLLDESYQEHLSRLKYAPENYATGRTGVFEMGRNFSFKLIVPFRFSGTK